MKYFEKISFTKEEKKCLGIGAVVGTGASIGLLNYEMNRHFKKYDSFHVKNIIKSRKIPIAAIIGGSALLGAGIASIKKKK
jgi:hypothetical protein